MNIKGSSKNKYYIALKLFVGMFFFVREFVSLFGIQAIIYIMAVVLLVFLLELYFDEKETISHDFETLCLDLQRYSGDIHIKDIQKIYLMDDVNDLVVETEYSTQLYKLYGFRRKNIQLLLASLTA